MVKGVARRVIMVKSPDPKLFEQALFLVREEAFHAGSVDQVLKEAEQAANGYLHQNQAPKATKSPFVFPFFLGAIISSAVWVVYLFV